MKTYQKYFFLVAAILLLAGCSKAPEETTSASTQTTVTQAPETEPATVATEPNSEAGIVLVDHVPAVLTQLSRGDIVTILGEQDDCYIVDSAKGQGLLEKRLVRTADQSAYESWTGYAKYGTLLHRNYHLTDDGGVVTTNTKVQVLEDLTWCYLVQVEDTRGYVLTDQISKQPIKSSSPNNDTGGGNGGGSSGGGTPGGQDGGDISLTDFFPNTVRAVLLSNQRTATVLVDDAELCLKYFERNDSVNVTQHTTDTCIIYLDGFYAFVPRIFVRMEQDEPYESWTGYAKWNAEVYDDYHLYGEPVKNLKTNTEVTVLDDLGYCYLVEAEGEFGMMRPETVSKWKQTSGNSSNGSGGSSGGSSSGGEEWTPPKM